MSTTNPVAAMRAFPKSDDFAVMLGLKESQVGTPAARSEQHKVDIMNLLFIPRLHLEHPLQQDVVFSRFAALYLPSLITQYLTPPTPSSNPMWRKSIPLADFPLANAYGYMLVHLNGNPYFNKFFRLPQHRQIRKELIMTILTHLDNRTSDWEVRSNDPKRVDKEGGIAIRCMIFDFCQLLSSLLLFESEDRVYDMARLPVVTHLMPFLGWWNTRYGQAAADEETDSKSSDSKSTVKPELKEKKKHKQWPAETLQMVLSGGADEHERMSLRTARANKGGISVCGMSGCSKRMATDGGALLQCSQCGTVRYCSEDHQRQAWKHYATMHKEMCHKPCF